MFVTLIVFSLGVLMMIVERLKPGRAWPTVRNWWTRAIALNLVQVGMVFLAGYTWNGWMVRQRPWSVDGLGLIGGAIFGYIVITFVYYWWHRWRHEIGFLWRWFHQVHHSPQRIEIITSFYKHPLELFANGLVSSAIAYWLAGLNAQAATLAVTFTGIAELFYHWNIKTPYWIGYLIQRPESHLIHHQNGLHAYNYADLPLWDMIFGTFRKDVLQTGPRSSGRVIAWAEPNQLHSVGDTSPMSSSCFASAGTCDIRLVIGIWKRS